MVCYFHVLQIWGWNGVQLWTAVTSAFLAFYLKLSKAVRGTRVTAIPVKWQFCNLLFYIHTGKKKAYCKCSSQYSLVIIWVTWKLRIYMKQDLDLTVGKFLIHSRIPLSEWWLGFWKLICWIIRSLACVCCCIFCDSYPSCIATKQTVL